VFGWNMTMSETTVAHTADLAPVLVPQQVAGPFWPKAVVAFGVGLTAAWLCFLGYGLVKLIQLAT